MKMLIEEKNVCKTKLANIFSYQLKSHSDQNQRVLNKLSQSCCSCLTLRRYCRRRNPLYLILLVVLLYFAIIRFYQTVPPLTNYSSPVQSTSSPRILYVVRTNRKFYEIRLRYMLQTWISLVPQHVYFVSDIHLPHVSRRHTIVTKQRCGPEKHAMDTLCCKTAHDFIIFHRHLSDYDWFCHFDDDQYVNTNNLEKYLAKTDADRPHYIGRNSWPNKLDRRKEPLPYSFWFATLGAGVCLSKPLVRQLWPLTSPVTRFVRGCVKENYFDDIYLGFLISNYLNLSLTRNSHFHSHIEKNFYDNKEKFFDALPEEISFGFKYPRTYPHYLPDLYGSEMDPYRIRTLHCLINLHIPECQIKLRQHVFNSTKS